jgi:hypothetical protein
MLILRWTITLAALLSCINAGWCNEKKIELRVLYLGSPDSERGKSYTAFLRDHFTNVTALPRMGFDPAKADKADVVILDWAQSERSEQTELPLGAKASWNKPTVLLGSAGLLLATRWHIHGTLG